MSQVPCFRFLVRSIHHSFWAIQEMWRKWRNYIWSEIHNADFTLLQSVALPLMLTKVFIWLWKYFQIMVKIFAICISWYGLSPHAIQSVQALRVNLIFSQTNKQTNGRASKWKTNIFIAKIATCVMCWQISLPGGILSLLSGQALIALLGGQNIRILQKS